MTDGLVTILTLPFYAMGTTMYYEMRGDSISHIVYRDFDKECKNKFHEEYRELWLNTTMHSGRAIVVTYQKWKKSGEWDRCRA